eukprot:PITA_18411
MAVRQSLAILQDEKAEINRGKSSVTKSIGLKAQQPDLSDRITLSNITNKPKRSSGLVTPIAPRKTENHTKGAFGDTFSSAKNGRAGVAPRTASAVNRRRRGGRMRKEKQGFALPKNRGADSAYPSSAAHNSYTHEIFDILNMMCGLEKAVRHLSLEVNRQVAQALSYRTEIPCFLPRAVRKDSPVVTDFLELDPVEDLCKKGDSPSNDIDMELEAVDYDDAFLECLEILCH